MGPRLALVSLRRALPVLLVAILLLCTSARGQTTPAPAAGPTAPSTPAVEVPSTCEPMGTKADTGDTAWMLTSTALVMVMMPGLALFYAGMVRRKNVLGTMMHSMAVLGIIGIEWVVIGY